MGEIIPPLCDAGREALGKLTSNSPEREENSWTNILQYARDDAVYCKVEELTLARNMDS